MLSHIALVLSCVALLAVIAVQDFLVPRLRNQTISSGLTGPDHVLLDASYVPLAASLVWAMADRGLVMLALAVIAAVGLVLVAATNTAHAFVDRLTGGKHSLWHTRFTITVFVSALALQGFGDRGPMWALTVLTVLAPGAIYAALHYRKETVAGVVIAASPAAEKAYVALLCIWFIVWAL